MNIKTVKISELKHHPENPQGHPQEQINELQDSLDQYDQIKNIVVWQNKVIAGNGLLMAAKQQGRKEIEIQDVSDWPEKKAISFMISDNRLSELAIMDDDLLTDLLKDFDEPLDIPGIDENFLDEIDFGSENEGGKTDPDSVPKDVEAVVKSGELWLLGDHHLLCGDSGRKEDVEKLIGMCKINMVFTSPPYAMQREKEYGGIKEAKYPIWFSGICNILYKKLDEFGSMFVNIKEHTSNGERSLYVFETIKMLRTFGWRYVDQLIWTKPGLPGKWNDRLRNEFEPVHWFTKQEKINWMIRECEIDEKYDNDDAGFFDEYEDIYHFAKAKKIKFYPKNVGKISENIRKYHKNNKDIGYSGNKTVSGKKKKGIARPGNVLNIVGNPEKLKHPAMFPSKLPKFFIELVTDKDDKLYDPFMGSGTTLIASEQTERICFGMERLPAFCDIILQRWADYTGKDPTREDGAKFSELKDRLKTKTPARGDS